MIRESRSIREIEDSHIYMRLQCWSSESSLELLAKLTAN